MILQQISKQTRVLTHTSCAPKCALNNRAFAYTSKAAPSICIPLCQDARPDLQQMKDRNSPHSSRFNQFPNRSLSTASVGHDFSSKSYSSLLKGLDVNTIPSEDDGHPLAVYTIAEGNNAEDSKQQKRTPVLLLHGRTWSSVPVYHLVGGGQNTRADEYAEESGESRSLIEALFRTESIQPYAMDFRGFGGTPKDESGFVEPLRCVKDVISVLNWIQSNHSDVAAEASKPALLGWSHGALIAQIAAQRHPDAMSKLIL